VELSVKKDKYFDNTYTENYVSELIIPPSKFGPTLSPVKTVMNTGCQKIKFWNFLT